MARITDKPAIEQVRDQLDLDNATTSHLSVVAQNLGFRRPKLFWNDDEVFRAVTRGAALNLKVVRNAFARLLLNVVGPRKTQIGYMFGRDIYPGVKPEEDGFYLDDNTGWPQVGTLIFDPDEQIMAVEETLRFGFLDPDNKLVTFRSVAALNHLRHIPYAGSTLAIDHYKDQTALSLVNAANLPAIAGPADRFAVYVGKGTRNEELHEVTAHTGNVLTLALPLEHDHLQGVVVMQAFLDMAPTLTVNHAIGSGTLTVTDGNFFQQAPNGMYIINRGQFDEERVIGLGWTLAPTVVTLVNPTTLAHPVGSTVEYVQIIVEPCEWGIWDTQATSKKLIITIPSACAPAFGGGAYFHEQLEAVGAGLAAMGPYAVGDTEILVPHAVAWEVMLGIGAGCNPFYPMRVVSFVAGTTETKVVSRLSRTAISQTVHVGDVTVEVDDWRPIQAAADFLGGFPFNGIIDRAGVAENVVVNALDQGTSTVTLNAGVANEHLQGAILETRTNIIMELSAPLLNNYVACTLQRQQTVYVPAVYPPGPAPGSGDLQDGNRVWVPGIAEDAYLGYYSPGGLVYDMPLDTPTELWTGVIPHPSDGQAIQHIPARQVLNAAHMAGVGILVMDSTILYPSLAQTPFDVTVNPGGSTEETLSVINNNMIGALFLAGTTIYDHSAGEAVVLNVTKLAVNSAFGMSTSGGVWLDYGFETAEFVEFQSRNATVLEFTSPVLFEYQHPAGIAPASMTNQPLATVVHRALMNGKFDDENEQKLFYIFGADLANMLAGEFGIVDRLRAAGVEVEVLLT